MRLRSAPLMAVLMAVTAAAPAHAELRLARLFGDSMVMQRGASVPVWGWATPGAAIRLTFDGRPHAATAGADGAWRVRLPAMTAGGPHAFTVEGDGGRIEVRDVLVGDVWVCSGQSNMEWTVADAKGAAAEIAAANDPRIRHFKVPTSWAAAPEDDVAGGAWAPADPEHVGAFTAVGYFFARDVRRHVDVPIGLLHTSWGGSRIEPWMRPEALGLGAADVGRLVAAEQAAQERAFEVVRAKIGDVPAVDAGLVDGRALWAAPDLDDAGWAPITVPATWEGQGYNGLDGVGWYRTAFDLTDAEARAGVTLGLGQIDDSDVSWVNGVEIGRVTNGWNKARLYRVPASALRAGRNVLAVRVEDTGGGGGIAGAAGGVFVEVGGARRPIAGPWRFRVGAALFVPDGQRINKVPTLLYNAMVHPLLEYPVAGVLWYQGESNADRIEDALAYRTLFPALIRDWRAAWGQPAMPFLFASLANYMAPPTSAGQESRWAALRESQAVALALPSTGWAVITDVGEADDIHPRDKQTVGARLALTARRVAYGQAVEASGPAYRSHAVRGSRVTVAFDHAGGLGGRGGAALGGFAVAGADRVWHWADARVVNGRVVVSSPRVPRPVAVRYAWADNPDRANLTSAANLPAAPFRTDKW